MDPTLANHHPALGAPAPLDADVVVIGAGAAGLLAASFAADRGRHTLLLEKNARPGLKILISGGGRCNVTTTRSGRDLERQYGERRGRFLRHALRAFPPSAVRELIEAQGVALHEEDLEKVFPVSRKARDVLDALLRHAIQRGVELRTATPMLGVERSAAGAGFVVQTPQGSLRCASLILATGGLSYPKTGATGDGYPVAEAFGHTLTPTVPALAPLALEQPWLTELQGLVVDARLRVQDASGQVLCDRRRPTLITHRGLSGPGPMDVSGFVEEVPGSATLWVDLLPDQHAEQIDAALLAACRDHGRRQLRHLLPTVLPERLRAALCTHAGATAEVTGAGLSKDLRRRVVGELKQLLLPVEHSLGFGAAEVTRGGVVLDEVDAKSMQSRRTPSLFLCGEILDIDGPIGGFNFQAAFATGRLAGLHA